MIYPVLCPPQNPPTTTTTTTTTTSTPGGGTSVVPGQQVLETPSTSGGDRVGAGNPAGNGGGSNPGNVPGGGAVPSRARGNAPIGVNLRGRGGDGRCWYAIVHLDTERDDMERRIRQSLGEPCYVATMRAPVDIAGLRKLLAGTDFSGIGTDDDGRSVLSRFGREIGDQLVTPQSLIRQVEERTFSEVEKEIQIVSGVVFTQDKHDLDDDESSIRNVLANAIVRGVRESKVPATTGGEMPVPTAGVEFTTTKPSWIPWYVARKISSVDNIDQRVGRRALSILMTAGGAFGAYGVKDTAQSLLPKAGATATAVRFRTAGAVGTPAEASAGVGAATVLIGVLLALTCGWAIGIAGRRSVRRRLAGASR